MTAKAINKNTLYFRQAAHHLGEREAERHLMIAMESGGDYWGGDYGSVNLDLCFTWADTPQGHEFWSIIYDAAIRDGIK